MNIFALYNYIKLSVISICELAKRSEYMNICLHRIDSDFRYCELAKRSE